MLCQSQVEPALSRHGDDVKHWLSLVESRQIDDLIPYMAWSRGSGSNVVRVAGLTRVET